MCGIVGFNGKCKCIPKVIKGLESLEYRGYDSAGIAFVKNEKIKVYKEKGRIANLKSLLDMEDVATMGIGHTRWATHGEPTSVNAHPHQQGKFTIVHNGIIENYIELKQDLIKNGYTFISETDTEVACALFDFIYKEEKDILKTIHKATHMMRGSFAFGILCNDDMGTIYATRLSSPLIVAKSDEGNFIASDVPAILEFTNQYYTLDDYDVVLLTKDSVTFYNEEEREIKKDVLTFEGSLEASQKNGYEHFMLKEINEQDEVIKNTIHRYYDGTIASLDKN